VSVRFVRYSFEKNAFKVLLIIFPENFDLQSAMPALYNWSSKLK